MTLTSANHTENRSFRGLVQDFNRNEWIFYGQLLSKGESTSNA